MFMVSSGMFCLKHVFTRTSHDDELIENTNQTLVNKVIVLITTLEFSDGPNERVRF